MKFSRSKRLEIIAQYKRETSLGELDPINREHFLEWASSPDSPAHEWFTWDNEKAGHMYRLDQATNFLRVYVSVTPEVKEPEHQTVVVHTLSPAFVGNKQGDYYDTQGDMGSEMMRRDALRGKGISLESWYRRYSLVLRPDEDKLANRLLELLRKRHEE